MNNKSLMTLVFAIFLAGAAQAATFKCIDAETKNDDGKIIINADKSVRMPGEENRPGANYYSGLREVPLKDADTHLDCVPKGNGGRIFENGSGPNSWLFRIPAVAFKPGITYFEVNFVLDEDNDGMACRYEKEFCTLEQ